MFDVLVNTLNYESSKELAALPGFLAQAAPRRPARGREGDVLALMVELTGSTPITPEQHQDLTQQLAARYFATPGTVTAGIRLVAESLNNYILNRNLRNAKEGWQAAANLSVAVIRRNSLYLGQAGSTHAYVVARSETQEFFDPDVAVRSLGTSRTLSMRYSQAVLNAGDMVCLCSTPPTGWGADYLAGSTQTSLDVLKRRLLQQAGADLKLALLQVQEGKGVVVTRRWSASSQSLNTPAEIQKPAA
ncbi:MAG: hypothetical protein HGA86_04465, partial [Anaerolineaceae bacterium]|nr:hypothetical protein [Anaerolineaceae bacterium]